eukprot:jgi/Mesvir1/20845/Mv07936-RA.3
MLQQRHKGAGSGRTRYGVLPQEAVCTENLTPWLKLLPCRDRAGLAALLAGPNLYGARFLSQGLEVRVTTPPRDQHEGEAGGVGVGVGGGGGGEERGGVGGGGGGGEAEGAEGGGGGGGGQATSGSGAEERERSTIQLSQTLLLVLSPSDGGHGEATRGGGQGGAGKSARWQPDWQLSALFGGGAGPEGAKAAGRGVQGPCPLAASSHVYMEVEPALLQLVRWAGAGEAGCKAPRGGDSSDTGRVRTVLGEGSAGAVDGGIRDGGQGGGVSLSENALYVLSPSPDATFTLPSSAAAPAAEIVSSFPDPLAPGTAAPGSKGDGATQGDALSWAAVRSSFLDYDLRRHAAQGRPLDVQLRWLQPATWQPTLRYPLEVHMAITGNGGGEHASILLTLQQVGGHSHSVAHGDQSGTMTATDAQPSSRDVHLLLVIPWYLRVYLHTLECSVDGGQPAPLLSSDTLLWHRLHPARDREAALLLELRLRLLASAGLVAITIDAEKAFLQYSEHPPDAHHGFPIPSAMATYSLYGGCLPGGPGLVHGSGVRVRDLSGRRAAQDQISNETRMASWTAGGAVSSRPLFAWNQRGGLTQLYSEGTLVHLATPDFSMPYNVITLTSTVLALLLGSLLNILLRRRNKETA